MIFCFITLAINGSFPAVFLMPLMRFGRIAKCSREIKTNFEGFKNNWKFFVALIKRDQLLTLRSMIFFIWSICIQDWWFSGQQKSKQNLFFQRKFFSRLLYNNQECCHNHSKSPFIILKNRDLATASICCLVVTQIGHQNRKWKCCLKRSKMVKKSWKRAKNVIILEVLSRLIFETVLFLIACLWP